MGDTAPTEPAQPDHAGDHHRGRGPKPYTRIGPGGMAVYVFLPAFVIIVVAVVLAIVFPAATDEVLNTVQEAIVGWFGWYYMLIVGGFVVFALFMGLSRYGDIKLGKDDDEPAFGLLSWFSMLFAAGMGIGLVFWGAAEPLTFFTGDPKPGIDGDEEFMALQAMAQTFLHWGFHAWAIYVVVGLALAYAIHRRGRPVSIRFALEPLLGNRVRGPIGDVIDVVAVVGTVFGVATSLGLGVQQISAGLVDIGLFDEASDGLLVGLIAVITAAAMLSVISGLDRGIRWLSNTNLSMAGVFLILMLILGPTVFLLREFVQSIGVYLQNVVQLTFDTNAYAGEEGQRWLGDWTIFYWGWWIAWAPFVGVFIARISRGRTVRQFVAGVLLVPTAVAFLWFAVHGGMAIYRQMFGQGGLTEDDGSVVAENALFELVGDLPLSSVLAVVVIILVANFFVTSSDSGSLVVDMLASGGDPDPPTWSRVLWAVVEGAVAVALLLAGGLAALQTGSITTALPFSVIMIAICAATYKAFRREHMLMRNAQRRRFRAVVSEQVGEKVTGDLTEGFDEHFGERVDQRIEAALDPDADDADRWGRRPWLADDPFRQRSGPRWFRRHRG